MLALSSQVKKVNSKNWDMYVHIIRFLIVVWIWNDDPVPWSLFQSGTGWGTMLYVSHENAEISLNKNYHAHKKWKILLSLSEFSDWYIFDPPHFSSLAHKMLSIVTHFSVDLREVLIMRSSVFIFRRERLQSLHKWQNIPTLLRRVSSRLWSSYS